MPVFRGNNVVLYALAAVVACSGWSGLEGAEEKAEGHPASYYSLYTEDVKLLPRSDKGLTFQEVMDIAAQQQKRGKRPLTITPGRPLPQPQFLTPASEQKGSVEQAAVELELLEERNLDRLAAVRTGVPLPQGAVRDVRHLAVLDPQGKAVAAGFSATALWPDGSLRWVAVDFFAPLKAKQAVRYQVAYGNRVQGPTAQKNVVVKETAQSLTVETGALKAVIDKERFNLLREVWRDRNGDGVFQDAEREGGFSPAGLRLFAENAEEFTSAGRKPASVVLEEQTPQRLVVRVAGKYAAAQAERTLMDYQVRLTFLAGSAAVGIEITHTNTELATEFTDLSSLRLEYVPAFAAERALVHTVPVDAPAETGAQAAAVVQAGSVNAMPVGAEPVRLCQRDDRTLEMGGANQESRLSGAVAVSGKEGSLAIALENCWQRWPKGFAFTPAGVRLDLLPEIPSAQFGEGLPHYLRFPFCEGKYRLKWGMSFTERLLLDFSGAADEAALRRLEAEANLPVVAVLPARHYSASGVLAAGEGQFAVWDEFMAGAFQRHMESKRQQREYGFLNYGDFFGERQRNWGNNEYDLAHGLFADFLRTGRREHYRWALLAARHQADSDIVHAYPDPYYVGSNHQHSIGHTGIWQGPKTPQRAEWTHPYDEHIAADNGHTWNRGMLDAWYLAGDARVMQATLELGEHIVWAMAPSFKSLTTHERSAGWSRVMQATLELGEHIVWAMAPSFKSLTTHERSAGWSLLAVCELLRYNGDPLYRRAADQIAEVALRNQRFDHGGAWAHLLPGDHARGLKDTDGNALFLVGILLSGLRDYHQLTGREEAKTAILSGAKWLAGCWSPADQGWPYTAGWDGTDYWPATAKSVNLQISPSVMYAARLSGDHKLYDIANAAFFSTVLIGSDAMGKEFAQMACFASDQIEDTVAFQAGHPALPRTVLQTADLAALFGALPESQLRVRSPDRKKFILQNPGAELGMTRVNVWPRSGIAAEGSLKLTAADGAQLAQQAFSTKGDWQGVTPIPAGAAQPLTLIVQDPQTALWNLRAGGNLWGVTERGLGLSMGGLRRLYVTVPAGTGSFVVKLVGVHEGNYGCVVLDERGVLQGQTQGENLAGVDLPWARPQEKRTGATSLDLQVKCEPAEQDRVWSLGLWSHGDLRVQLEGIPPLLGVRPIAADAAVIRAALTK